MSITSTIIPASFRKRVTKAAKVITPDKDKNSTTPHRIAFERTAGPLAVTREGTWAFYLLGDTDWDGVDPEARDANLEDFMQRMVDLEGLRVWFRGTSAPWNAEKFIRRQNGRHPRPLPDNGAGGRTRVEHVAAQAALPTVLDLGEPVVVLGVRFTTARVKGEHLAWLLRDTPAPAGFGRIEEERQRLRRVTRAVARPGLAGTPLTGAGLQWLHESSVALGHAPATTGGLTAEDVFDATRRVRHAGEPMSTTIQVSAFRGEEVAVRHNAVRHVNRITDRDSDTLWPFLGWLSARRVEWVACFDVHAGKDLVKSAEWRAKRSNDSLDHDADHKVDRGQAVVDGAARAVEIVNEVTHGDPPQADQAWGRIMVATSGGTPQEALDAMSDLVESAARYQHVTLGSDIGMDADVWRFTPGEPWDTLGKSAGHRRELGLDMLASLGPTVTGVAGSRTGIPLGSMAGSCAPYLFDLHDGPRNNRPGTIFLVGEQGCGKSALASMLVDQDVSDGHRAMVSDPTGRMARLAAMRHMRGQAAVFDLATSGKPGMLMPHYLDPEPDRRHYPAGPDGDEEYADDVRGVAAIRMDRAIDAVMMCLPEKMAVDSDAQAIVEDAVAKVGGGYGTHSREIIDAIEAEATLGRDIAERLRSRARLSDGAMIFPDRDVDDRVLNTIGSDAPLTIVTMRGLSIPQSPDRSTWTREQRRSVPILALGWQLAIRGVWADTEPKTAFADELGVLMGGFSSVRSSILRLNYDSRKVDAAAIFAAQTGAPIRAIDEDIDGLVGAAFIGRIPQRKVARRALPLLGDNGEHGGWDQRVTRLDTGEFIVSGFDRKVRQVRVDQASWHEDLIAATHTTPGVPDAEDNNPLTGEPRT